MSEKWEKNIKIDSKIDNDFLLLGESYEKTLDIGIAKAGVYQLVFKFPLRKKTKAFVDEKNVIYLKTSGDSYGINDYISISLGDLCSENGYEAKVFCFIDGPGEIGFIIKNLSNRDISIENNAKITHIWEEKESFLKGSEKWVRDQKFYGKEYYNSSKENYESGYDNNYRENALKTQKIFITPILEKLDYKTSLEIGCSMGGMLKHSIDAGKKAFGVDYSFFALKGTFPSVRENVFCADIFNLPVKKDVFDLVIAQEVLEHIYPQQVLPTLEQIYELCKKYFVVTVPCGGGYLPDLVMSIDDIFKDRDGNPREGHLTVANIAWWKEQFMSAGFYLNDELAIDITKSWGIYSSWWQLIVAEKRELPQKYSDKYHKKMFSTAYEKLRGDNDNVYHIEGVLVDDTEKPGNRVIGVKKEGPCGYILFGPYDAISEGVYSAFFELKISNASEQDENSDVVLLEVKTQFGGKIHGSKTIKINSFESVGQYQTFDIAFESLGEEGFEFTVYFCGKCDVSLRFPVKYEPNESPVLGLKHKIKSYPFLKKIIDFVKSL